MHLPRRVGHVRRSQLKTRRSVYISAGEKMLRYQRPQSNACLGFSSPELAGFSLHQGREMMHGYREEAISLSFWLFPRPLRCSEQGAKERSDETTSKVPSHIVEGAWCVCYARREPHYIYHISA